jgi:hypothetical protein
MRVPSRGLMALFAKAESTMASRAICRWLGVGFPPLIFRPAQTCPMDRWNDGMP